MTGNTEGSGINGGKAGRQSSARRRRAASAWVLVSKTQAEEEVSTDSSPWRIPALPWLARKEEEEEEKRESARDRASEKEEEEERCCTKV